MASTMVLNPSRYGVRIVGKIRGFNDQESVPLSPWIVVQKSQQAKSSQDALISFAEQSTSSRKDAYEMDYCYEQDEDNPSIYSKEVEPFIPEVFDGRHMTIIAYGARGSGKSCTIQGTEEKPGLAIMTMADILSKAESIGYTVSVAIYEVCQDHVYDLLDTKRPEIQVLEAQGKINLKGLSKVVVKSVQEFSDVYFTRTTSQKEKSSIMTPEPKKRSHKVLTVYILSTNESNNRKLVGKMNFIDLAGYEDSRRNNTVESSRINKSLYSLLNVIHALNSRESRVPYRESKLTHMLKDSLGGKNHVLMLACMNPLFCQDTIHTVTLASRSCQSNAQIVIDSKMGSKSASKLEDNSSTKSGKKPPFLSAKKPVNTNRLQLSQKKDNSISKGRKLFDRRKTIASEQQLKSLVLDASISESEVSIVLDTSISESEVEQSNTLEDKSVNSSLPLGSEVKPSIILEDNSVNSSLPLGSEVKPSITLEDKSVNSSLPLELKEDDSIDAFKDLTSFTSVIKEVSPQNKISEATSNAVNNIVNDMVSYQDESRVCISEKENMNDQMSPPLSEKIKKISDNLKALLSSSSTTLTLPEVEPKTPVNRSDIVLYQNSPWEAFTQRSSGMKNSYIQEYLKFLNSASKEELKGLKGIKEKRATYILELREESPEPFKTLDDLEKIGLSAKQVKTMMKRTAGDLFS